MTQTPKGVHREIIKAEIRKRDTSLSALSIKWGYVRNAISVTLQRPWPAVEKRISQFIKIPPQKLWPERYTSNGVSKYAHRSTHNSITSDKWGNNQSRDAA